MYRLVYSTISSINNNTLRFGGIFTVLTWFVMSDLNATRRPQYTRDGSRFAAYISPLQTQLTKDLCPRQSPNLPVLTRRQI